MHFYQTLSEVRSRKLKTKSHYSVACGMTVTGYDTLQSRGSPSAPRVITLLFYIKPNHTGLATMFNMA